MAKREHGGIQTTPKKTAKKTESMLLKSPKLMRINVILIDLCPPNPYNITSVFQ